MMEFRDRLEAVFETLVEEKVWEAPQVMVSLVMPPSLVMTTFLPAYAEPRIVREMWAEKLETDIMCYRTAVAAWQNGRGGTHVVLWRRSWRL